MTRKRENFVYVNISDGPRSDEPRSDRTFVPRSGRVFGPDRGPIFARPADRGKKDRGPLGPRSGPKSRPDRGTGDRGPNWTAVSFFCGPDRSLDLFQLAIINHDYISKKFLLNVLYYYISLDFVHFF